jgi:hypothetical protein
MNLFVYIFGKVYIKMYSFANKLSLKMAIMDRNMYENITK